MSGIQYCTTDDGIRIAYALRGSGAPLIMCPFFVEGFANADELPEYREFVEALGRGRTLIQFDMRGTGMSQRDVLDLSLGALMLDIRAVARAARSRRFMLYGGGLSGPRAIAYAAAYPRQVSHLLLYSTFARATDVLSDAAVRAFSELARSNWTLGAQTLVDLSGRERVSDLNVRAAKLVRESADGTLAAALLEATVEGVDVTDHLQHVRARTLVVQSNAVQLFRAEFGQRIAAGIPHAQLRMLSGNVNWLEPGVGTSLGRFVDEFLGDAPAVAAPVKQTDAMAVILFTDIADSTPLTERMGDAAFRAAAEALDKRLRSAIRDAGGTPVEGKVLGDGVMAVFTSAARTIEAARRCVELSGESELRLHVGLHAGDVIHDGDNVYGGAVNIASRICGLSSPGEILVSATIRDLARTSAGVAFEDRGAHELKGVSDAVRVFAVVA